MQGGRHWNSLLLLKLFSIPILTLAFGSPVCLLVTYSFLGVMVVCMLKWLSCCIHLNVSVTMLLVCHQLLAQIGLPLDSECRVVSHNLYVTNDCRAVLPSVCSHVSSLNACFHCLLCPSPGRCSCHFYLNN